MARPAVIGKSPGDWRVEPHLVDYERARATFSWEAARRELDGLPGGRGLNIAHEAVDRHAAGPRRDHVALRFLGRRGDVRELSYATLRDESSRFANLLCALGVGKGERVFSLAGRIPKLTSCLPETNQRLCPRKALPLRQNLLLPQSPTPSPKTRAAFS